MNFTKCLVTQKFENCKLNDRGKKLHSEDQYDFKLKKRDLNYYSHKAHVRNAS